MKQTIKLRESELKWMIGESVKRVLNEATDDTTDGALNYQGSPKHKDFMFKRGQFYGGKSGIRLLRNRHLFVYLKMLIGC